MVADRDRQVAPLTMGGGDPGDPESVESDEGVERRSERPVRAAGHPMPGRLRDDAEARAHRPLRARTRP